MFWNLLWKNQGLCLQRKYWTGLQYNDIWINLFCISISRGWEKRFPQRHKSYPDNVCKLQKLHGAYIDGLVQDCSNSSALAMELLQSCTKPSICVSLLHVIICMDWIVPFFLTPNPQVGEHECIFCFVTASSSWKEIILFWFRFRRNLFLKLRALIQYKMSSYQYRKSHYGDKTILRPSYLHNGISYTGKMISLYWIRAQRFKLTLYVTVGSGNEVGSNKRQTITGNNNGCGLWHHMASLPLLITMTS